MEYLIIISIILVNIILVFVLYKRKEDSLKKEEEERKRIKREKQLEELHKKQKRILSPLLSKIADFKDVLSAFMNSLKYISNYDILKFKNVYSPLFEKINNLEYKHLPDFNREIKTINYFISDFISLESNINKRNIKYVENELAASNSILSDIEGKSLDNQQRKSVIIDQDNNLIIAGAGSGKTTTIAGKVRYLTERLKIDKNKILLISFTRKSADEMSEIIKKKMGIELAIKTFHKLGLDIISKTLNVKPSIFSLSQKEILELIASFLKNKKSSKSYSNKLLDFLAYYLKPYKALGEFTTDGEHNNYLKEQKFEGYKIINKTTSQGVKIKYREKFKSQEEVLISNFLFRNQIEYEYEEQYQYKTASKMFGQYKPDFYLPEYDIYIEHFGIDKDGNVPKWFKGDATKTAQEKYTEGINWKRTEHSSNGTTLIETYSWEQKESKLLSNLEVKLKKKNVIFNALSDNDLWEYISANVPEDIDVFTRLINTFLVLFKSNNERADDLLSKAVKDDDIRAVNFLELFTPILNNYENYLQERNEIDFSDMINLATDAVISNQFSSIYEYIIIDEFQDISKSRYQLIKALLDQKPSTKLFCVGDDWQSIYRFAGSDIGIFTCFEEYFKSSTLNGFKRKTNISYIEKTYRFDNKLIELSSNFILKNPNQIEKSLKSIRNSANEPITFHKYNDNDRKGSNLHIALNQAIDTIIKNKTNGKVSILLLGRYDFESKCLEKLNCISKKYDSTNNRYKYIHTEYSSIDLNFLTVHSSKGLEADYVIILNGNSGTYGFPSEISDDPLLNFLLSKADQFPNGEERRLFYVALTRAKIHVHILSSIEHSSKFINEIKKNEPITSISCDWCDNGKLIERKGPYGFFYACNNSNYCNYTRKINKEDFITLAETYLLNKDFEKAIEYFQKTINIGVSNSKIHYDLARAYEQNKKLEEALNHYNTSINLDNSYPYAFYWRASVFYDLNKYDKAIEDWLFFKKLKPNSNSVYYWLSLSYFKTRHFIKAIEFIQKELSENPNNKDAHSLKKQHLDYLKIYFTTKEGKLKSTDIEVAKGYIQLAIDFDVNIKFNYYKSTQFEGGIKSLRTIKPSGFKVIGQFDSLCVSGYCYLREEERTFNLERISDLVINPSKIETWSE